MRMLSEKCIVRQFCYANNTKYITQNMDSQAYYIMIHMVRSIGPRAMMNKFTLQQIKSHYNKSSTRENVANKRRRYVGQLLE